jgi:DNA-binding PucR family transcriptional regulator
VAVLALGPQPRAPLAPAMRAVADTLAPGLRGRRLTIGVSEPVAGAAALPGAAERARHAHRVAAAEGGPVAVVASDDLASYVLLLAGVPAEGRAAFQERLLGRLRAYDRTHHADLVRSLETFLSCSGSWHRSARELHVHVNTLRYRLRRVEELTGRDLGRFEDRVDLFLALRLTA